MDVVKKEFKQEAKICKSRRGSRRRGAYKIKERKLKLRKEYEKPHRLEQVESPPAFERMKKGAKAESEIINMESLREEKAGRERKGKEDFCSKLEKEP